MKHLHQGFLYAAVALSLAACNDDNPWSAGEGEGAIRLALSASSDVTDAVPVTRAEGELQAPAVDGFSVLLEKNDGSFSKEWSSLEEFRKEAGFKTGNYTITAFYGSPDEEGFEKPYFAGSAPVTVLEGRETRVEVVASLANSMVSIDYTDAFRNYFSAFSAKVHSEGHSYVDFAGNETRPAFIAPGNVDITVSLTDKQNRTVEVQPAAFIAEARHHYHVTINVNNGNVGEAQLVITFDDSVEQEAVTIDLTDELFSSPAPAVTPSGFANGDRLEILQNDTPEQPMKFSVMARGGLASATLTINSESYHPAFGNEIDLVQASPAQQEQMAHDGLKVAGFYKNPDKMAFVDITDFAKSLPAGVHTLTLVAKDRFTRVSEPVSITFDTNAIAIDATVESAIFGSNTATITVSYNGKNPEEAFSFKAEDNFGGFVDCQIQDVRQNARTRAIESKNYDFTIQLPDTEREKVRVRIYYYGSQVKEIIVPVVVPEYSVAADAFSNRVLLKVTAADDVKSGVVRALKVKLNGTPVEESSLVRDTEHSVIYVKGLTPATQYAVTTSLTSDYGDPLSITTEAQTPLPNGDLSQTTETINIPTIITGGSYSGTVWIMKTYWIESSIVRSEADGWASLNQFTCWTKSNPMNTWFAVPSTFVENGVATVRSVGYSHNGTLPGRYEKTAVYYNINAPTFSDANKVAGEMFLGTYTFDNIENRKDGLSFASRPTSLTFSYEYASVNSEQGYAYITVLDASGNTIASGSKALPAASSMKTETIALNSYKFQSKAASIRVGFKSMNGLGVPAINVPTGNALNEGVNAGNFTSPPKVAANQYKAVAIGSVLKVKDIKLNY